MIIRSSDSVSSQEERWHNNQLWKVISQSHLRREPEIPRRPLLGAELENASLAVNHRAQRLTLLERQAKRLLKINVFAGTNRRQRDQDVPVIGRCYEAGIDVLPGDELPEIMVGLTILI